MNTDPGVAILQGLIRNLGGRNHDSMVCLSVCNKHISGGLQLGPSGAELGGCLDRHGEKEVLENVCKTYDETSVT